MIMILGKTTGRIIRAIGCFLCVFLINNVHVAQSQTKVERKTITLGAQNQKSTYGGFVDLSSGMVYSLSDVNQNQQSIDLVYAYGTGTKINLMMPSSTGLQHFGASYRAQVYASWDQKNRGTLLAIESNRDNRRLFRGVTTNEQLEEVYEEVLRTIHNRPGYIKADHGPGARIKLMEIGDYILVKSRDRDVFAIGRIVDAEPGFQGYITIDFKVTGL